MTRRYLSRADRRSEILVAATRLAERECWNHLGQREVAAEAGCSMSLIHRCFGSLADLRDAVMAHAVATENLAVVLQGLALRDPVALAAPIELRRAALLEVPDAE